MNDRDDIINFYLGKARLSALDVESRKAVVWVRAQLTIFMNIFFIAGCLTVGISQHYLLGCIVGVFGGYYCVYDKRTDAALAMMALGVKADVARVLGQRIPHPPLIVDAYRVALCLVPVVLAMEQNCRSPFMLFFAGFYFAIAMGLGIAAMPLMKFVSNE